VQQTLAVNEAAGIRLNEFISMKKSIVMLVLCSAAVLFTGCAAGVKRIGYQAPPKQEVKAAPRGAIAIQKKTDYDKSAVELLGKIKVYDAGFSTECDEALVLDLICSEGYALKADLVIITKEKYPDLWSTCFRADADFVRFKDREAVKALVSDAQYAPELIIERSERAGKRTRNMIIGTVAGGVLGGIIAYSASEAPTPNAKAAEKK
jgi:hypothetical protein